MDDEQLSATFTALADPTRRAILKRLATGGEATVNELAEPFAMSLQAISKHLKVLERAGLISRGREAQFRPCRLEIAPLTTATQWIEDHRQAWIGRFDRLESHLLELQQAAPTDLGTVDNDTEHPGAEHHGAEHHGAEYNGTAEHPAADHDATHRKETLS